MSVSPSRIDEDEDATLRWTSDHVNDVRINQGVGHVNGNGSRRVSPNNPGTYTYEGTFYGDNGQTITCSATLRVREVEQNIVFDALPVINDQPLSYVYLSDLPYTGLDLGPIGTALYWLMLIGWSLAIAYLVLGNVAPMALRRVGILSSDTFGHQVQEHYEAPVMHAPVAHAPVHAAPAPVAAPVRASAYDSFRQKAQEGTLTIDDIVKGLAQETDAPVFVPPVAAPIATAPVMTRETTPALPHDNVPAFIDALLNGQKDQVFGTLRDINRAGGNAETFLTHVTMALDDAFRNKLDGTAVHPEVAKVCENCAPNFLERVISSLSTAVDSSYTAGVTGVKLAVTRALAAVEG
jgi:hypothetical protein